MARDGGLEALLNEVLEGTPGCTQKRLFGGWAWMLHGNLLCAARQGSMMFRLGRGNDGWALQTPGLATVVMRGRPMPGWVRATPEAFGDDALRAKLLQSALRFVSSLPPRD